MLAFEKGVLQPVVYIHRSRRRLRAAAWGLARVVAGVAGAVVIALGCTATRQGFAPPDAELSEVLVEGLVGKGLVLQTTGGDVLPVASDGAFQLPAPAEEPVVGATPDGAFVFSLWTEPAPAIGVTVRTQPEQPAQRCAVGAAPRHASGVAWFVVACAPHAEDPPEPDLSRFDSFQ